MKKKYGLGIVVVLTILMLGVCGCTMNNSELPKNTESEVTLSARQKSILSEQGLSTEYDKLTSSQQKAIVSIEDMLLYVENKYNASFSYAGYTAASSLEKESMRAYPTSGDKETDCFTITKTENGYTDDYINQIIGGPFATYVCNGLKTNYADTEIKVFQEITETTLTELPTDCTEYDGKVECSLWIFIDKATFTEDDTSDFRNVVAQFMSEHQIYGMAQIVLLNEGKIAYLTNYNYTDYLSEEHYLSRENVYVNK